MKEVEEEEENEQRYSQLSEGNGENPLLDDPVSLSLRNHLSSAPWISRSKLNKPQFALESFSLYDSEVSQVHQESNKLKGVTDIKRNFDSKPEIVRKNSFSDSDEVSESREESINGAFGVNGDIQEEGFERVSNSFVEVSESPFELEDEEKTTNFYDETDEFGQGDISISFKDLNRESGSIELPWERQSSLDKEWRSNTEVAEKTIPETELKRLRNISLRMLERIKVGASGITQALVDKIHEKWKREEVVKLKFEGPAGCNMKRTHETLESRTGGLVIWRSGSSLVLYRGMAYKLHCVQQYTKLSQANTNITTTLKDSSTDVAGNVELNGAARTKESPGTSAKSSKDSSNESMDIGELNNLLNELGPRFVDWSGPEPLPVDADLLPSMVPGYTPPFRLLPYKVRPGLGNKRMTSYRRLARTMPPHFALGRNRDLQGLALAMVKLWERNALAKIAIKRGVLNTRNERMAEELKRLTGGILMSRNKEYIVFYRGNDFLSPSVTEALVERKKIVEVQQEEEEIARERASALFVSNVKATKGPLVAGTLAETLAAKSRWGNEPSSEELEKMKRDFASAKHASLVRYLEKKIARAQDKINKAEKALRKVQESLIPTELPNDLEIITDEERVLYRKMGLSMRGFLLVGRREVFDGTVENIHLHWKHHELVKVVVRGKNFPQVKHIAISLEAESGGLLVSVDKTNKGYAIIIYRGKNYQRPQAIRPKNLLTKRQALARSIELQRREALIHHISDVCAKIKLLKSGLDRIEAGKETGEQFHTRLKNVYSSDDDFEEEGEEAYLETYSEGDEDEYTPTEGLR
ncbi:Crm-domain containing factor cfm3b protein [Thalictrum thalictroides]|uniref:Crm-domain containing factor cfm3b protein n=1 Tax=Thalictrum thalictroides TaxID=46969 RepID=A0A7J6WPD5_THATH|nr:Crm-domain containing factor cfm3b protein [Thalictrum thalictroides]